MWIQFDKSWGQFNAYAKADVDDGTAKFLVEKNFAHLINPPGLPGPCEMKTSDFDSLLNPPLKKKADKMIRQTDAALK